MNNLYEALEICLRDIEQGADIETVLFRHPDLADELRPILEASENAKSMAVPDPSTDMLRRNRTKLLQHAAGMREAKARSASRRIWSVSLRRVAVTLVVVAILFASGTGLVRAASTTLPGDNLYPVKRTWEDVLLLFTFNVQQREALEIEHENKRLEELNELFAEGRSEKVDFAGLVTLQNGDQWLVAGFPVVISAQTEMPDQQVAVGSAVRVIGVTGGDGIVLAERVKLLPPGAKLPDVDDKPDDKPEIEEGSNEGPNQQNEDNSGTGSEGESPQVEGTETPEIESENSGSNRRRRSIRSSPEIESENSGSNSGSGSDSNNNDNTSNGTSSNDENSNDGNSNDGNSNDSSSNNDNSSNDNGSEDNSNDGGNSGSGGGGGAGWKKCCG